jgi:hypothetical protein
MTRFSLPFSLALASSLFLSFGASAVPINAADGVADTVPTATSGARRPGLIPKPAADVSGTQTSNGRGRPVPGKSTIQLLDNMAEITPSQMQP